MNTGAVFYPNISSLPGQSAVGNTDRDPAKKIGVRNDFDHVLEQLKVPLKFSSHATQRLKDRKINFDPATLSKINEAVEKAEAKGLSDTLILTKEAALIVNVPNRTVITAMDRSSMNGNVFTNIDGAVII